MSEANGQEYKKYSQHITGQFKKKSKKDQALFIGRAIQLLRESIDQHKDEKKFRMETLRYVVEEYPATADSGEIVDGWIIIQVSYEIGSMDPYTEEDRINDEKRLQEAQARREEDEKQYGEKAMQALEEEMQNG